MSEKVKYELESGVALIVLDDGKANALSHEVLDAFGEALDQSERDKAGAVVVAGRPGRFSAGFDLSVMQGGGREAVQLLAQKGAHIGARIFDSSVPVVFGVTGHALAMGAVLCLAADVRIGARGDYKLGLNEVAIGMALPPFAMILAEERISRRYLTRATAHAEIFDPESATEVGYLDWVVDEGDVTEAAVRHARVLSEKLNAKAHRRTKADLRKSASDRLRATVGSIS